MLTVARYEELHALLVLNGLLIPLHCTHCFVAGALDWAPWLALRSLEHLHLHVNPAWRAPLQPSAVAAMAAAWPRLTHLHLRLSPSDNHTHALQQLGQFKSLKYLSLTWLGQAASTAAGHAINRGRRSSSLESAALNLAYLPEGLEVGSKLGLGVAISPL
jgi:hypothetical protein